jgi:phosphoglycolate phosphatase-like HAD superfamily hydrolase
MPTHYINCRKAILFDWDDTLVATFKSSLALFNQFANYYHLSTKTLDEIAKVWGKPIKHILKGLWGSEMSEETILKLFIQYVDDVNFTVTPYNDTLSTLKYLVDSQCILGIISSGVRKVIEKTITEKLGMDLDVFYFIHTKEETSFHKPDPRVFNSALYLLNKANISKEKIYYVGDMLTDYEAAKNANIPFIAVTRGINSKQDFIDVHLNPSQIIASLSELPLVLSKIK